MARKRSRVAGSGGEHRPAVNPAHVDRHPCVTGDEIGDLPDVHLDQATSDDESNHGREES